MRLKAEICQNYIQEPDQGEEASREKFKKIEDIFSSYEQKI